MALLATHYPTFSTAAMLRQLHFGIRQLAVGSPYQEARLRRFTDQFSFVVETWSGLPWPAYSRLGEPVPAPEGILAQLAALPVAPAAQQQALQRLVLLLY